MSFKKTLKQTVGENIYNKLEKEATNEVSLAKKMNLKDIRGDDNYYFTRFLVPYFISEAELFEEKGLTISPVDIFNVLFRCKMLFCVQTEDEYRNRVGGGSFVDENKFLVPWGKRSLGLENVIDEYLNRLENFQSQKTLRVEINSFHSCDGSNPQNFFDNLFKKLDYPFTAYIDESALIEQHRLLEPDLKDYSLKEAKNTFCPPSIGFTTMGSTTYSYWYASAWLRTFLAMLKIAGFLNPAQLDFGSSGIEIMASTSPVFLGTHTQGSFCWDEDKKEPWLKIPDGCLWRSFGYRGISKMWLDSRTSKGIELFITDHKQIFESLQNPWNKSYIKDIAPTFDILSSAIQTPDTGAKILLIYCCYEHLFVPENIDRDNKKYIIGGINALKPDLLKVFDRLYNLRCDYAHKGYIKKDKEVHSLITQSIKDVMMLLKVKLNNSIL